MWYGGWPKHVAGIFLEWSNIIQNSCSTSTLPNQTNIMNIYFSSRLRWYTIFTLPHLLVQLEQTNIIQNSCSTPHAEWAVREVLCPFLIGDNCIWANVRFQNIDVFCIFVDGSVSSFHLAQNIFDFFFPPSLLILEKMWNWEVFQYQFAVTPGERCQFRHASLSKFPGIAP